MKKFNTLLSVTCLMIYSMANAQNGQIENGGFENWETTILSESPSDWGSSNEDQWIGIETVSKITDASDGTYSIEVKTLSFGSTPDTTSGYVFHGNIGPSGPDAGIPYTGLLDELRFDYKSNMAVGDSGYLLVYRFTGGTPTGLHYEAVVGGTQTAWTQHSVSIPAGTQDEIFIGFLGADLINDQRGTPGSTFQIDNIQLFNGGIAAIQNIPDPSFENWTEQSYEDPTAWFTLNPLLATIALENVTKTTDANSGSFALKMETVLEPSNGDTIPSFLSLGLIDVNSSNPFQFAPYSAVPVTFSGAYKYAPVNGDAAGISMEFFSNGSSIGTHVEPVSSTSTYTTFSSNLTISGTPDSISFVVFSGDNPGSVLILDDFAFGGGDVSVFETNVSQVEMYPNPSSGILNLNSDKQFDYTITNISGSIVLQGNDLIGSNSIAVSNLPNGNYIVNVTEQDKVFSKKLIIIK